MTTDTELPDGPLREADPQIREEQEKLEELVEEKKELEGRIRDLRAGADRSDDLNAQAEALLDGEEVAVATAPRTPVKEKIANHRHRVRVLGRAASEQQDRILRMERGRVRELAKEVRPQYRTLLQEIAEKLVETAELIEREREIHHRLEDAATGGFSDILPAPPAAIFSQLRFGTEIAPTVLDIALDTLVEDHDLEDPRS